MLAGYEDILRCSNLDNYCLRLNLHHVYGISNFGSVRGTAPTHQRKLDFSRQITNIRALITNIVRVESFIEDHRRNRLFN